MTPEYHIDREVIANIILVFLVGRNLQTNSGDFIRDWGNSECWCTWSEVENLRSGIVKGLSNREETKGLARELKKVWEYCNDPRT